MCNPVAFPSNEQISRFNLHQCKERVQIFLEFFILQLNLKAVPSLFTNQSFIITARTCSLRQERSHTFYIAVSRL